jgi:hypothetical protein
MEEQAAIDANETSMEMDAGISSVLGDNIDPNAEHADITPLIDDGPGQMVGVKDGEDPLDKGKAGDEDLDRFDKIPRFQELIQSRQKDAETIAVLKAQIETLAAVVGKGNTPPQAQQQTEEDKPTIPYRDVTQLSKEELLEWQEDDPHAYAANLYAQMLHETRTQLKREQRETDTKAAQVKTETSVRKTYEAYEVKNPDFRAMWDSGAITKYMDENPGHNAISAHMAMTEEGRIQAATVKAAKEAEAKVVKNFQAKRGAQVLGTGPGRTAGATTDQGLTDTKLHGGLMNVLSQRLKSIRDAA